MNQRNRISAYTQTNAQTDDPTPHRIKVFSVHSIRNECQATKCNILRVKINHGDTCDPEEHDCPTVETTVSHTPYLYRDKLDTLILQTNKLLSSKSPSVQTRNAKCLATNTLFISNSVCNNKTLQHTYTIMSHKSSPYKAALPIQGKVNWGNTKRSSKTKKRGELGTGLDNKINKALLMLSAKNSSVVHIVSKAN